MLKKTMIIAAAIASTIAAMPMAASAQSWGHGDRHDRYDRRDDRRDWRHERRDDRREWRQERRDYRYDNRYRDDRRYYGSRYYRGAVLPYQYRSNWYIRDYNRYGYGPPPRGYGYYRTDTGDIVVAALATGVILSLLSN